MMKLLTRVSFLLFIALAITVPSFADYCGGDPNCSEPLCSSWTCSDAFCPPWCIGCFAPGCFAPAKRPATQKLISDKPPVKWWRQDPSETEPATTEPATINLLVRRWVLKRV
jgi:hypothetical protein